MFPLEPMLTERVLRSAFLSADRALKTSDPKGAEIGLQVPGVLLRLYIAGNSASSQRAQQNLAHLREIIKSRCEVEVIDVVEQPQRAERAGIIATPTLCYENAPRPRRVVGDLSESKRILDFLGIETKDDSP